MQKYRKSFRLLMLLIGILFSVCMSAQQIAVKGIIKDQTGETAIGANIVEKGTTNGTITGIEGNFTLTVSSQGILQISFIGYKTQEVAVNGQQSLQIVLVEDSEMLEEVVVVEYGTMKKSDLTGAVASVGNKELRNTPAANLGQAIQGKISGVQVINAECP